MLIDIIIMIWIVADIIVLTAMYFVDLNNFYNAIIIFDTGLCVGFVHSIYYQITF